MAKSKKAEPAPDPVLPAFAPIDASSPDVVLEYSGGATPRGVPARDLTGNDLARIQYRRTAAANRRTRSTLIAAGEERTPVTRPAPSTADELEHLVAELSATGRFARNAPGSAELLEGADVAETSGDLAEADGVDEPVATVTTDQPDIAPPADPPATEPEG